MLNRIGEDLREDLRVESITLPHLPLLDRPVHDDTAEIAARLIETRTVRAGRDCWQQIGKANSFESWKAIGAALAVGKAFALRATGANRAWGRSYSRAFSLWIKEHKFERMAPSLRSVAIEMHENIHTIESWRSTLTDRQRQRLAGPLQNVRRWRRETAQHTARHEPPTTLAHAEVVWRRFVVCVSTLPQEQAAALWQAVKSHAVAEINNAQVFD